MQLKIIVRVFFILAVQFMYFLALLFFNLLLESVLSHHLVSLAAGFVAVQRLQCSRDTELVHRFSSLADLSPLLFFPTTLTLMLLCLHMLATDPSCVQHPQEMFGWMANDDSMKNT